MTIEKLINELAKIQAILGPDVEVKYAGIEVWSVDKVEVWDLGDNRPSMSYKGVVLS